MIEAAADVSSRVCLEGTLLPEFVLVLPVFLATFSAPAFRVAALTVGCAVDPKDVLLDMSHTGSDAAPS
jgi:hypothetical protein